MQNKVEGSQFLEILARYIENDDKREISLDDQLTELGISSIEFIKFIVGLEEELEIEFEDEDLNYEKFDTLNDLYNYVVERRLG